MPRKARVHRPSFYKSLKPAQRKREERESAASRGYDRTWRKLRLLQLAEFPLCSQCSDIATEVDHIVPIVEAPHLRLDPSNLQSLCKSCHSRKTMSQNRSHGANPRR